MKTHLLLGVFIYVSGLLIAQVTQAQGTTYVSNLGQPSINSVSVGSDSWIAMGFRTGTNAGGYDFNSAQLSMANATGKPSGYTVMLYSSILKGDYFPENNLITLNGSLSPVTGGIFTYTPATSLTLSPNTGYFIVVTAGTMVANGAYQWSSANYMAYNQSGGWEAPLSLWGIDIYQSSNGSSWGDSSIYPEFAINATAVPEPSLYALLVLGGFCFFSLRSVSQSQAFIWFMFTFHQNAKHHRKMRGFVFSENQTKTIDFMKTPLKLMCAAVLSFTAFQYTFAGTLVTFDDLSPGSGSGSFINIPNGYENLQWLGFGVVNGSLITPVSGYNNGIVSPNNVAFNDDQFDRAASLSSSGTFNLNSAYLTSAFSDGMQIEVQGFVGTDRAYDQIYTLNETGPALINFNFAGTNQATFSPVDGTSIFVMDNLTVSAAPEPDASTMALLGLAVSVLGKVGRMTAKNKFYFNPPVEI